MKIINSDMEHSSVCRGWALPLGSLFFICALYWSGHGGDLGYWTDWMEQMAQGYGQVQANYPPLLLHWFWLLAKLFDVAGFEYPPVSPVQLKFFVLLPVLATQLWLCYRVERSLCERNIPPLQSPVFWCVVASPALLLDGPVWGQVDLLPFLPMWLSLVYAFQARFLIAGAAFALALLWKFQAIVILPVLAGLFMRRWRLRTWHYAPRALAGLLLVGLVGFLPFIWVGRFAEMFHAAYLGNTDIFPFATFNAANLWYLLADNTTDMHQPLLAGGGWLTPHKLGLALFVLVSVVCMLRAWLAAERLGQVIGLSMVMVLGFFALAPSMHERYLFLLVPLAALGCARGEIRTAWLLLANLAVACNILLVLPLEGDAIWRQLSWLVVFLALLALATLGLGLRLPLFSRLPYGGSVAAVLVGGFMAVQVYQLHSLNRVEFDRRGRAYLSDIKEEYFQQDWGRLSRDASVSNDPLNIYGRSFGKGLGVHAFSRVVYRIPEGANFFHSYYGLDRAGESGSVRFSVLLDGRTVWSSGAVGWQPPQQVLLSLRGAREIALQVDSLGSITADHANWAEAGFWQTAPSAVASARK